MLKFGSSVLARPDDYLRVADVVATEVARGRRVVAVVSAMGETTDSLLSAARSVTPAPPDSLIGALLATGEEASVALLVLALAARRVRASGFNAWRVPVRTRGPLDDADPVSVDAAMLRHTLRTHDAVAFPGFIGVDSTGVPSVLGRGGSDLTALFLGHALGAAEVRLVKDVGGVFPSDPAGRHGGHSRAAAAHPAHPATPPAHPAPAPAHPATAPAHPAPTPAHPATPPAHTATPPTHPATGPATSARAPTPFATLTWSQARAIGGGVVQPKALDFAARRRLRFRVVGLDGAGTLIG